MKINLESIQISFRQQDYTSAIAFCEAAIEEKPDDRALYWYLGVAQLLDNQPDAASMTWLSVLAAETMEEAWVLELVQVLRSEAIYWEQGQHHWESWLLRTSLQEILADDPENCLALLRLAVRQENDSAWDLLESTGQLLLHAPKGAIAPEGLLETMSCLLDCLPTSAGIGAWMKAAVQHLPEPIAALEQLLPAAMKLAYGLRRPDLSIQLAEAYLSIDATNLEFLYQLTSFFQDLRRYEEGIQTAEQCQALATTLPEQIFASHLRLRGLMSAGGYWQRAQNAYEHHCQLLQQLTSKELQQVGSVETLRVLTSTYYLPYFQDGLATRKLQNNVSHLCQENVHRYLKPYVERYQQSHIQRPLRSDRKIKLGYLSHCFSQHSVGWLAKWLIQYHDRDRFDLYAYSVHHRPQDSLQNFYSQQFQKFYCLDRDFHDDSYRLTDQIHDDSIDILIDLDSLTLDITCEILAMKPAPIQVTWLGWDATGLSNVDYFIADPYVLPAQADQYYQEKIIRLPQTYLAVDGFEVGIPTLTRSSLNISEDAVIYLSSQTGCKRHLETARAQVQILNQVPNSYFLIKGFSDALSVQQFFHELADEVGVDRDRLRFLPNTPSEAIHRANLRIADVVLDTFPYNGATTTMETLWMEVPLVTQVGQQFAARNSYTMMVNAGIEEGIAWN
ncbi:MAG: O-linked N-acetylglucosamine transferase, SPINDLY family protein, partial [Synechococcales bacterium]|nr:O-linked N-acetylglucosamine transferase, SPINDLY family protein [Synechococcales bacterium]